KGGDPPTDDRAATRRSPRLETPPGFPPRPSSPPPQPATVDSGAETSGAELGGVETEGEGSGGAATGGAATRGAESGGALTGGACFWGAATGGATSPSDGGAMGDPAGGSPGGRGHGLAGAGAASPGGTAGGAGGAAGAGGTRGVTCAGGAGAGGTAGARGARGATGGAGAGGAGGFAGTGGARAGGTGVTGGARAAGAARARGAAGAGGAGGATGAAGARGAGAAGAGGAEAAGSAPHRLFFYPQLQSSLPPPDLVIRQSCRPSLSSCYPRHSQYGTSFILCSTQPPDLSEPPASSLPYVLDPKSDLDRAASPTVTRLLATVVTNLDLESTAAFALVTELVDFAVRSRLHYVASLVTESEFVCPSSVRGEPALSSDVLEDRQFELECLAAALPRFVSMLLARMHLTSLPRALTPRRSWGVDFFQTFSPTPKMTTLRVLLHVAAQRDYKLHSLDFSTAFMQGSLHKEIWLRGPPGFTRSFPAGTQWSLHRPVYGLRQAPQEWHVTLRTTLAALGFAPSTADPSLFLCTDTTLPPFYVLVYVEDLVFATADTEVLQCFRFQFSSPQPTPLSTGHSLSAPPLDESVEPSGPYPEHVGCLMYLMTCTRPDLTYPLSLLARYVAPGRHRKVHLHAAKRALRYLCSTLGMGQVHGGQGSVELRWLTYPLTDLGERPCSPPVLYVENKATIALCHEQRLEHRTRHISLRYFLAHELQQRRQIRLSYVASRANTADVFTKALGSGDHQRFCTALGLVPTLPHLLVA
ncbi:unnamed protein product, partial [Closterium sp. NIES-53]